jgi:hypothetical protein
VASAAAQVEAPVRRPAGPASRPRRRERGRGVFGGVVWIAGLGLLLAGVVALNVAVLRLNVRLDELTHERANVRATNAALSAQLSTATATAQVEALAARKLGLVPAEPEQMTYLDLSTPAPAPTP